MTTQEALFDEALIAPDLPTVDGHTLVPDPDSPRTTLVLDLDGTPLGRVGPARGKPPAHTVTNADGRKHVPAPSVEHAARFLIRLAHLAAQSRAEAARCAALTLEQAAGEAWDHHEHAARTGHNYRPHRDGTPWALSDAYQARCQDWLDRNPDRDAFMTAQAAGRDTALGHHLPGADRADILADHVRVGDLMWGAQVSQGGTYAWRQVLTVEPDPDGNGVRLTHAAKKGAPPVPLAPQRNMTVTVRTS